jgi:hypothetical protein
MNSKIAAVALLAVAAVLLISSGHQGQHLTHDHAHVRQVFDQWIVEHGKTYSVEEKVFRFGKFLANYIFVQHHNARFDQGLETYDLALNKFADLDRVEFKATYTGLKKSPQATLVCTGKVAPVTNPPDSVDWTTKGIVTPVKDQGQCGSCWAFSTTGALEGLGALEKGKLNSLSEQQLVDCAGGVYTNEGCNGGDMDAAMWYVIDNGITTETLYPYRGRDQKCAYKDTMKAYQIKNCAEVTPNKTHALAEAVAAQPVSISVEADQTGFQLYKSGVFNGKCGTNLDHGVKSFAYRRFCLSVMEPKTVLPSGRPRTRGEEAGEARATSFSERALMDPVSAASSWTTPFPSSRFDSHEQNIELSCFAILQNLTVKT